jgi:hypothetical protein
LLRAVTVPMEFFAEEIEVRFEREPLLEKRPGLPAAFTWRSREYVIVQLIREWHDYRRRGRTRNFYEKERGSYWVKSAQRRGSWGVGRDFYRVLTDSGDVFDIYYDRAPQGRDKIGQWILSRRLKAKDPNPGDESVL